jgi:predicted nuclease of predicted toxin-antitoxin system
VKLLFDQNLSRHLVFMVAEEFPESSHVVLVGLDTATDRLVWEYAKANGYVIVSKDSDFGQFAFLYGPPDRVVHRHRPRPCPQREELER